MTSPRWLMATPPPHRCDEKLELSGGRYCSVCFKSPNEQSVTRRITDIDYERGIVTFGPPEKV